MYFLRWFAFKKRGQGIGARFEMSPDPVSSTCRTVLDPTPFLDRFSTEYLALDAPAKSISSPVGLTASEVKPPLRNSVVEKKLILFYFFLALTASCG